MRTWLLLCICLLLDLPVASQKKKESTPQPKQFEIGVFMFFDFGPPFDFYNLYVVRPSENGTELKRFILTPPADICFSSAKLETASATTKKTVAELFGAKNPCGIPEKDLRREAK